MKSFVYAGLYGLCVVYLWRYQCPDYLAQYADRWMTNWKEFLRKRWFLNGDTHGICLKRPRKSNKKLRYLINLINYRIVETASRYEGQLRMYWISSGGQPIRGGPPDWGLGVGLTHHLKISLLRNVTNYLWLGRINLFVKPEGKRPLGRTRRRWVDNIKIDFRVIGWVVMDWNDLAQDRASGRLLCVR
jgi:hypothetical protein